MIAGEQQTFTFKEETKVIAGMARRVHCGEFKFVSDEPIGVAHAPIGFQTVSVAPRNDFGTGRRLQCGNPWRMIWMCMRAENPSDRTLRRFHNRRGVNFVLGTRIDHSNLVLTNQIGVCPCSGHMRRIRSGDAFNEWRNCLRHVMNQRRFRGEGVSHSLAQVRSPRSVANAQA